MAIKIHYEGPTRRRLIVRGRDVPFWTPSPPPVNILGTLALGLGISKPPQLNVFGGVELAPVPAVAIAFAKSPAGVSSLWPDPFMSYTSSSPISLNGVSNQTIEYLSFENLADPQRPITLTNCHNITIRRIDSRRCSMGLVYAVNCTDITVEYCRAENITGPYERVGANRANFYQFNNVNGFYCHHMVGRYGDTEDVWSHYASENGTVEDIAWEGAIATNQPTSDSSPSIPWRSGSGTGAILGDSGGANMTIRRATFLNPGQVGVAIAGGIGNTFEDVAVMSTGNPPTRVVNVASYIWQYNPGEPCSNPKMLDVHTWFHNNNEFWNGGGCGTPDLTGSVFGDHTLDDDDYKVVL